MHGERLMRPLPPTLFKACADSDSDIDIHDPLDLEYAIATRMRGDEDIVLYPNVRGSTLDPRAGRASPPK